MSRENGLIRCLKDGGTAICLPIRILRSAHILHMARSAGFDSIYIDMEQSDVSIETIGHLCQAAWGAEVTPLVRVPKLDKHIIRRVLDGGAGGVIVPHVDTVEMARKAVDAARFAPRGSRSGAGAGLALRYDQSAGKKAEQGLDQQTILIAMIESTTAVNNADAIAGTDGIDMLFVGTGDLSRQLGVHGDPAHPKIREAYAQVAEACRRHNKSLGVAGIKDVAAAQTLGDLHRLGARFISARTDEALLAAATREESKNLRQIFAS
jgi:2-keto-3-deoxy-L-rhamnonate aldolase RhmA